MGCPLSKTSSDEAAPTKSIKANGDGGGGAGGGANAATKAVDPRLPLNVRQKFNLTKSWKGISREMEMTGVLMFVKLFEENSELLTLFTKFQELKTKDSQLTSMELAEHGTKVMSNLDEMINAMDDMDYFFHHLRSLGKFHRKIPGFKGEYFMRMENPFLEAVKEVLQDRYTENMENIYNIIIKLILNTLKEGFEKDFN